MKSEEVMVSSEEVTEVWKDYENGIAYLESSGLRKKLPQFVRFYEGDQWPPPTKLTKNMPRPVVNVIKMICRSKKAAILSVPVRISYECERADADVERLNHFAEYIQKEIGQERLDGEAISDGVKKGCYVYHYYWDSEARGKDGSCAGGVRCEIIDPLNIIFANPCELDEQKQKWIIIASRESVDGVKAKADKGIDLSLIKSDVASNEYGRPEQEGSEMCTVLTRYFRRNGEVYCEKAVKGVVVNKAFSIAPDIEGAKMALGLTEREDVSGISAHSGGKMDAPNNALPDDGGAGHGGSIGAKAYLYPIVVGSYEKKEHSIYGLGEVEGLIPNQKAINFNIAMTLYNNQQLAWGKYIVLPNALGAQVITNEPGQVLTDYSRTGTGIRKLTEQSMQSQPMAVVDSIITLTRNVTGASEIMTGEAIGSNMSGSAIAQLQSQAQMPIEDLRRAFWQVKEKQGAVLAQFFKLFYFEKDFSYQLDGEKVTDVFNGSDYLLMRLDVVVDSTKGTNASSAGDINLLDGLFKAGAIDARGYISSYPSDSISNKSELLRAVDEKERSELAVLSKQIEEYANQVGIMQSKLKQSEQAVESVMALIEENGKKDEFIARLYAEARQKIQSANSMLAEDKRKIDEATSDATLFASELTGKHPQAKGDAELECSQRTSQG